jgi:hypothetical protein
MTLRTIPLTVLVCLVAGPTFAWPDTSGQVGPPDIIGRWDLIIQRAGGDAPSWVEIRRTGYESLVGRFVARVGSARPIGKVEFANGKVKWSVPPQWEKRPTDIVFEGKLEGDTLSGETTEADGKKVKWTGKRAPELRRDKPPVWGESVELFDGKSLDGWKARRGKQGWVVRDGLLVNATPGTDLVSDRKFEDFKLHAEFRYPKDSNSGIYLRGRYEVQIEDNFGLYPPDSHHIGGIYGFLTPSVNASKPAGEWQTIDVELVGRIVTVVLNGERIIDRQRIPGITGGALDSDEDKPGPVMLQGDHGAIEFRRVMVTEGK